MKYIILSILVLFSLSAYSQIEDTPLFVGKYFGNQSGGGAGYWQVTGNFTDESGYYDATSIQIGDILFFVDAGVGYHLPVTSIISASGSSFTIRVNNTGISGVAGVPNGPGGIYRANSPKGIWPFTAGLTASDQQTLNSFLIKRLNNEPVKRDTFITVPHSTNYIPNLVIATPSRFYNNIYISCKGISDTSTVAFLAAPTSDHYGVVYNVKNDSGLVETRVLSDAHLSNTKTSYLLKPGQMAQVRALRDQRQAGAYKWAVNLLWDSTVVSAAGSGITALTGDVTASGTGSVAATIANNAVTSAKVASQTLDSTDLKNRGTTLLKLAQSGASNGQIPKYNSTTGNWEPATDNNSGGGSTTLLPKYVPLFIFWGESNSGGFAVNADATAPELAARPNTRIFNPTTRVFESLDVGTNNLIGHTGLAANATHGWELELANQAVSNPIFKGDSIYIVKCGQGGSIVSEWQPSTTPFYFDTAVSRIKTALALLKAQGKQPQIYILYSQGINDSGTGTNSWAASTKTIIANIKNQIGDAPVLMTELIGAGTVHNANIYNQIAKKYNNVYYVNTPQGIVGDSLRDSNHWSYIGMKKIAQTMVRLIQDSVGIDFEYLRKNNGTFNLNSQIEALNSQPLLLRAGGETAVTINTSRQTQIGGSSTPYALLSVGRSGSNASQLQVHKGSDDGLFILSNNAADTYYQTGASFSGSAFIAKATSASVFNTSGTDYIFNANTGLTVGNSFTPTQIAKLNSNGLKIGTGSVTSGYELDVAGDATVSGTLRTSGGALRIESSALASFLCYDRTDATKLMGFYSSSALGRINSQAADLLTFDLTNNRVSNGLTSITANFHLKAGTATVNTAPLKFTSGTSLTTAEAGAVEYDGTEFYATNSTASRTILARVLKGSATLDFPDTASGSSSSLTITVNGAATTDSGVSVQRDNASISGTSYEWVITGVNTVTVYFHNFSGSNQNPVSGTFRATVTK